MLGVDDADASADPREDGGLLESVGYHRRIVTIALAKLLPFGGTFTELYNAYIPTRRAQRQVALIESLQRKVERLGTRIDESRILSEPYADVFEDVLATVATRQGLDKREYYASVLANALTVEAPEYDRQLRLVACLDNLRPSHLRLLAVVMRDLLAKPGTSGSVVGPRMAVSVPLGDDQDEDLITRDWIDMVGLGIFSQRRGSIGPPHESPVEYAGGTARLSVTITEYGREFAQFVGATGSVED